MLGTAEIVAFVPMRNADNARTFYRDVLGLKLVSEDDFALVFDANGVMLRVANVSNVKSFKPFPFTVLGWLVESAEDMVRALENRGVEFERFPGMDQDDYGIWNSPSGAKVAWFKDPEGNILSITQA